MPNYLLIHSYTAAPTTDNETDKPMPIEAQTYGGISDNNLKLFFYNLHEFFENFEYSPC